MKALKKTGSSGIALAELDKIQGKRLSKETPHGERYSIRENFKS